jgi:hypothetical protein
MREVPLVVCRIDEPGLVFGVTPDVCRVGVALARSCAAAAILCLVASAVALPGAARADGDPASDVLIGQDIFTGYGAITPKVQDQLYSVTTAAQNAGYPVRIALIDGKGDLGSVPQEFGHPESYAHFLSYEISGAVGGTIVVVMPNGFGVASHGQPRSVAALAGIPIGPGTNGLGAAAVAATEKLAAAAGHPLGAGAASAAVPLGASAATVRSAVETLIVLCLIAAVAVSGAVVARRRRRRRAAGGVTGRGAAV